MKEPIQSVISAARTLADNTVQIKVEFGEIPAEQMTEIFYMKGKAGYFMFALDEPKTVQALPPPPTSELPEPVTDKKSQSQTLRAVIWQIWKKSKSNATVSAEEFYQHRMKLIIAKQLDELDTL